MRYGWKKVHMQAYQIKPQPSQGDCIFLAPKKSSKRLFLSKRFYLCIAFEESKFLTVVGNPLFVI